jgi:hypothetical protein
VRTVQLRARQGRSDLTHSVPVRHEPDAMHGCTRRCRARHNAAPRLVLSLSRPA